MTDGRDAMNIHEQQPVSRGPCPLAADPRAFGRRRARDRLDRAGQKDLRSRDGALRPLVTGAVVNTCYNALDRHVAGGRADQVALIHDSPLAGTRHQIHLCAVAARGADARRRDAGFRRRQGRPRHPLYADGAGSRGRDAGLRADRRGASGGVRRFCGQRTGDPDRGRQAETDLLGELRARARPHRAIQAAARRGDQAVQRQAARPASSCSGRNRHAN